MTYGPRQRIPPEHRFWPKVDKSGDCWLWMGHRGPTGYGRFALDGKHPMNASRASWIMHNGPIPSTKTLVCHSCDNPPCVRPDHLFLGDHRSNAHDMVQKGRGWASKRWATPNRLGMPGMKGTQNPAAKLTWADVAEIRRLWPNVSQPQLARRFGVSQGQVWSIVHYRTWKVAA